MTVQENTVHYLEIVTHDVQEMRDLYAGAFGWKFGEARPELGNALVAELPDGSLCGIRAPMHEQEEPIVRTYVRVADIEEAAARVKRSGAMLALEPTEIPGHGKIAICFHGGVQHGLWQLP